MLLSFFLSFVFFLEQKRIAAFVDRWFLHILPPNENGVAIHQPPFLPHAKGQMNACFTFAPLALLACSNRWKGQSGMCEVEFFQRFLFAERASPQLSKKWKLGSDFLEGEQEEREWVCKCEVGVCRFFCVSWFFFFLLLLEHFESKCFCVCIETVKRQPPAAQRLATGAKPQMLSHCFHHHQSNPRCQRFRHLKCLEDH